jgi:hypothetical protein
MRQACRNVSVEGRPRAFTFGSRILKVAGTITDPPCPVRVVNYSPQFGTQAFSLVVTVNQSGGFAWSSGLV